MCFSQVHRNQWALEITFDVVPSIGRWLILLHISPVRYPCKASSGLGCPCDKNICQYDDSLDGQTNMPNHVPLYSLGG